MQITYDKKVDAMYIYFQKGKKIVRTVELADMLVADLDRKGKVVGVAKKKLAPAAKPAEKGKESGKK